MTRVDVNINNLGDVNLADFLDRDAKKELAIYGSYTDDNGVKFSMDDDGVIWYSEYQAMMCYMDIE